LVLEDYTAPRVVHTVAVAVAVRPAVAVADGLQYRYLGQRLLMPGVEPVLDIVFREAVQIIPRQSMVVLDILVFLMLPTLIAEEEEVHKPQGVQVDLVIPLNTLMELLVHT
jgi:hypothetical protein